MNKVDYIRYQYNLTDYQIEALLRYAVAAHAVALESHEDLTQDWIALPQECQHALDAEFEKGIRNGDFVINTSMKSPWDIE